MTDIGQLRADFKAVFANYRKTGELSEGEAMQQYREAAQAVQEHMHDENWLQAAAAHFRQLCIETERDDERRVRIANEVRAEKCSSCLTRAGISRSGRLTTESTRPRRDLTARTIEAQHRWGSHAPCSGPMESR